MMLCVASVHADMLRVVVIDTGINLNDPRLSSHFCANGSEDFTGNGLIDKDGHGTHVVGLIEKYAKDSSYCIVMLKFSDGAATPIEKYLEALREAVTQTPDIINLSLTGEDFSTEEKNLICNNPHILFIVAAGNESQDLSKIPRYPGSYDCENMEVVGSRGQKTSNYGGPVRYMEDGVSAMSTLPDGTVGPMTGTSQAAAIHTGKVVCAVSQKCN